MTPMHHWLLLGSVALSVTAALPVGQADTRIYIGTYTGPKSKGIYTSTLNEKTGELTPPVLAGETVNPTFLALHPSQRFLYAANEIGNFEGTKAGSITSFSIKGSNGGLTVLNQASSLGNGPCHLVVDRSGKMVLAANYGGGSVVVLPIHPEGRLEKSTDFKQHQGSSINERRQEGPHAHYIDVDSLNRHAYVADLGLDKILVYDFDATRGMLEPAEVPFVATKPGAGPRHMAFHPNGQFAYLINELDSTVTAYGLDAKEGRLKALQTVSTLPTDFTDQNYPAEIEVHSGGKFLYGSNRGHDSIAVYRIAPKTGLLTLVEHAPTLGKSPRHFAVSPSGRFLLAANQGTDNVVVFRIDPRTGRLKPTGHSIEVGSPVCVRFLKGE